MNVASTVAMARLEEPKTNASSRAHTTCKIKLVAPETVKHVTRRGDTGRTYPLLPCKPPSPDAISSSVGRGTKSRTRGRTDNRAAGS